MKKHTSVKPLKNIRRNRMSLTTEEKRQVAVSLQVLANVSAITARAAQSEERALIVNVSSQALADIQVICKVSLEDLIQAREEL
jgi:predicted DNA-binding transcriptional regulator YafY